MDPFTLLLASGALQTAGQAFGAFQGLQQARQAKSQARQKIYALQGQADLATLQGTAQANQALDAGEAVIAGQAGYFAANNIDFQSNAPAFLAAETAARVQMDVLTAQARGQQGRADAFSQMASVQSQADDASRAGAIGVGTAFLNTLNSWASLGLQGAKGGMFGSGGGGAPKASGPMMLRSFAGWSG
jgi:hypothetical protein